MKVTLQSTTKIVEITASGSPIKARVWEGETEGGVPCVALITRIAVKNGDNASEFERELLEQQAPTDAAAAFPLRMIL